MDWQPHADRLAAAVTHPVSRWRPVVAAVPRHIFVPSWWEWATLGPGFHADVWDLHDGRSDPVAWLDAAYRNRSLVTQAGPLHADHAKHSDRPTGMPTSSATLPGLLVQMFRHALINNHMDVLDVGTGSGYGCALLAHRLSSAHVTSIDVDDYLTAAATHRLASVGLHPTVTTCDATGPLPGDYDRIVSTVAVRPVPASWLAALRPGGRLVTTITGTSLIVTADKTADGGAAGVTEWDRAGFMQTRHGPGYPTWALDRFTTICDAEGEQVSTGRYPVVNVAEAWELYSTLALTIPGELAHHYEKAAAGRRTAWILHTDGSWARATTTGDELPEVHQSGPQRLWNILDGLRHTWLRDGSLPAYGAKVTITPDGGLHFQRGHWHATIPATRP